MPNESKLPNFNEFSRWLTARVNGSMQGANRYEELHQAAREARDAFLEARHQAADGNHVEESVEVLRLLAAADSDAALPPEIITPRGFRITLAYDEGNEVEPPSIGVLVICPSELTSSVEGKTVYLWNGSRRFELGQFDAEGKAIGALPAGIEITASDFAQGRVKLEAPDSE